MDLATIDTFFNKSFAHIGIQILSHLTIQEVIICKSVNPTWRTFIESEPRIWLKRVNAYMNKYKHNQSLIKVWNKILERDGGTKSAKCLERLAVSMDIGTDFEIPARILNHPKLQAFNIETMYYCYRTLDQLHYCFPFAPMLELSQCQIFFAQDQCVLDKIIADKFEMFENFRTRYDLFPKKTLEKGAK